MTLDYEINLFICILVYKLWQQKIDLKAFQIKSGETERSTQLFERTV